MREKEAYNMIKKKFGMNEVSLSEVRKLICPRLKIKRSQANWLIMRMHCKGILYRNRKTGKIKLNGVDSMPNQASSLDN